MRGSGRDYIDLAACIDDHDGSIKTDAVLTAGSVTIQDISAADAAVAAILTTHPAITDYTMGETTVLPWATPAQMYTEVWEH